MELLNILESSLIRIISPILRFKVQSRIPGPPGAPENSLKWYKFENQNGSILSFNSRKGVDDASKYQV